MKVFILIVLFYSSSFGRSAIMLDHSVKSLLKENFNESILQDSSQFNVNRVIKKIYKTGFFDQVKAESRNNTIVITGKQKRITHSFLILGNKLFNQREIASSLGLVNNTTFSSNVILEKIQNLKKKYQNYGYFNTSIELSFKKYKSNLYKVIVKIKEKSPCLIESIDILTANKDLKKKLEQTLEDYHKKTFSSDIVENMQEEMRQYLKDKNYLQSSIKSEQIKVNDDKTQATLVFSISNPQNYEFYFLGNKKISRAEIYRYLDINNNIDIYSINPESTINTKIEELYKKNGYSQVQLTPSSKNSYYKKKIYINISEGPRVKIQSLTIKGYFSKNPNYYENFILNNSTELISYGWYNRQDFQLGIKNLILQLRNIGYINARHVSTNTLYNDKKDKIQIEIFIDEGPLTLISKIEIKGNKKITNQKVLEILQLSVNQPLELNKIEKNLHQLILYYKSQGFLEANILNTTDDLITYQTEEAKAIINLNLYEGPQIKIKKVIPKGNKLTKNEVVLRELELKNGEILKQDIIDESKSRLNELGLFTRVELSTLEQGTPIENRNLIVNLSERNPGLLRFGLGVNNEDLFTLRGFTSISYLNLFGTAKAASARVDLKSNQRHKELLQRRVSLSFLEPFLLNKRLRGRANFTHDYSIYDINSFALQESNKIELLLEKPINKRLKLTWNLWSLDSIRTFQDPIVGITSDFESSVIQISSIGPAIFYDNRDNPFIPTKGFYASFSFDYSSPFLGSSQKIEFLKTESVFSFYQKLFSSPIIFASSIQGGYLQNLSPLNESGVPASRTFILGGHSTLRGFGGTGVYERVPNAIELDSLSSPNKLIIPNNSVYYLIKTELRFPIPKISKYGFGGVLFYDGGSVLVSHKEFEKPYRHSYGVGIRVNTPVGPVVFDYAIKIDKLPEEEAFRIHFSIGSF